MRTLSLAILLASITSSYAAEINCSARNAERSYRVKASVDARNRLTHVAVWTFEGRRPRPQALPQLSIPLKGKVVRVDNTLYGEYEFGWGVSGQFSVHETGRLFALGPLDRDGYEPRVDLLFPGLPLKEKVQADWIEVGFDVPTLILPMTCTVSQKRA